MAFLPALGEINEGQTATIVEELPSDQAAVIQEELPCDHLVDVLGEMEEDTSQAL